MLIKIIEPYNIIPFTLGKSLDLILWQTPLWQDIPRGWSQESTALALTIDSFFVYMSCDDTDVYIKARIICRPTNIGYIVLSHLMWSCHISPLPGVSIRRLHGQPYLRTIRITPVRKICKYLLDKYTSFLALRPFHRSLFLLATAWVKWRDKWP